MITKGPGPSKKKIIIPINKNNFKVIGNFANFHIFNINRCLKKAKSNTITNFIWVENNRIIITTNKTSSAQNMSIIEKYLKENKNIDSDYINSPCLPKSKLLLWDALDMNNFYFLFLLFSDFIGILFFFSFSFSDNKEACDIKVTWLITWCDVIGLEGGRRIGKMTSGHMKYIWWPWGRHEVEVWTYG